MKSNTNDDATERFARADLMAAVFGVADTREIGVVAGPVKCIRDRRTDAEPEQHEIGSAHFGEK